MKIKILGTAAAEGIPGVFCNCPVCEHARMNGGRNIRTRSQSIINDKYLIDFPMDSYLHSLKFHINFHEIEHIMITHPHEDHYYPYDLEYRYPPYGHGNEGRILNIYGPGSLRELYPNMPTEASKDYVKIHQWKAFHTYPVGDLLVTPLKASHARDFECFVYIIESEGKRLLYGHDSGFFPEPSMEIIRKTHLDCVICDTTNGLLRDGTYHMGVEEDKKLRQDMLEAGCADENTKFVMTHLSHNGRLTYEGLEKFAAENGFLAAYDGFEVEF
jgi:phosphoribosyl 1,2-cyclic phosphate phosphodiesterase